MPFCDLTEKRGITIYHETSGPLRKAWKGDKEQILFLIPGSTGDLRKTSDQQYIRQSEGYLKIFIYDHRNTGQTTIKDEPCTMEDYADDAAALLEAVYPEQLPINVMGVSFGGMVAQHLALRHPHLVKKLVLCCCGAGGEGGSPFDLRKWYVPGMTPEERVVQKVTLANLSRTEEWRKTSASEWEMVNKLLMRDEGVGKDDPLREEGITRQLEARAAHNVWDALPSLEMPVLCCGSNLDGLAPPEIMEPMVKQIGDNCESKLDFGWGHPFIAADIKAMPFINEWLRKPEDEFYVVVGGADKGGILVRIGAQTSSDEAGRLSTGAIVQKLDLEGERLQYKLLSGTGPETGWVSLQIKGKVLLEKTKKP